MKVQYTVQPVTLPWVTTLIPRGADKLLREERAFSYSSLLEIDRGTA